MKEAVQAAGKAVEERPAPFEGKTMPLANLTVKDFGNRVHDWIRAVQQEEESPTAEQLDVLRAVAERILQEFQLDKEGCMLRKDNAERQKAEEPMRGFIHGGPGTGKSRVIKWIIRMFTEALQWEPAQQFSCFAFQNRVADAMSGTTLLCCRGRRDGIAAKHRCRHLLHAEPVAPVGHHR